MAELAASLVARILVSYGGNWVRIEGVSLLYTIVRPELALGSGANLAPIGRACAFDHTGILEQLGQDAGARLVVWAAPVAHLLAVGLAEGQRLAEVQSEVEAIVSQILDVFRKARRQVLILPVEASGLAPERLVSEIDAYFTNRTQPVLTIDETDYVEVCADQLLLRSVAVAAVKGAPGLERLDRELDACMAHAEPSAELLAQEALVSVEAANQLLQRGSAAHRMPAGIEEGPVTALDAQRALNSELQEALLTCQGELEWYHQLASQKQGGLEQRRLEREVLTARKENRVLRDQLAALEEQCAWASKDADELRLALDQTRNSTSWRLTAPIRRLRGDQAHKKVRD